MIQYSAMSDMYKQLEEVMQKCDSLSTEVKTIKKETKEKYKKEIKALMQNYEIRISLLKKENIKLKQDNVKLPNEVDRLKKQVNNDSDNSLQPPSSDIKRHLALYLMQKLLSQLIG